MNSALFVGVLIQFSFRVAMLSATRISICRLAVLQQGLDALGISMHRTNTYDDNSDEMLCSVHIKVPPHIYMPQLETRLFHGKWSLTSDAAVESACFSALVYLQKVNMLIIDGIHSDELKRCQRKLLEASFWAEAFEERTSKEEPQLTSINNKMKCIPLSALCVGHQKGWIRVRASRVWHHRTKFCDGQFTGIRLVLVDEEGNSIYAMVPYEIVGANIHRLHESLVYELSLFQVSDHSRYMNPVDNPLAITFTELTIVQLVHSPNDMFPEITYRLTSFADLPEPADVPRHFLDVIGVIRAVSRVNTFGFYGTEAPVSRRHVLLSNDSDSEIRVTLLGEAAFRFNAQVIRFLGQEESAIIIFVGTTVHSHEGSKELVGAPPCRWYINRDIQDINILRARFQSSFQPIAQLPIPRPMIRRRENDACLAVNPLSSILSYDFVQNQTRQFRCNVKIWRLTPGRRWWLISCAQCGRAATPAASTLTQPNRYKCSDVGCPCTDASLEYCLHLLGSDDTGKSEFTLRGTIARDIVGVSLEQTILNNCPRDVPFTNLALAATQIRHTPSELAAVVSWNYEFLIDVTANSFQANWASFDVRAVEACYPPE